MGPGEVECLRGHELGDTIGLVEAVMLQLRDAVEATSLEAEGGGRCLESNAVSGRGTRRGSGKEEREERDCTGASEAARRALGRTSRLNMMGGKFGETVAAGATRRISLPTQVPIGTSVLISAHQSHRPVLLRLRADIFSSCRTGGSASAAGSLL